MFVIAILVIVFVSLVVGLYQKYSNAMCTSKKRLDGKTVIVTGGTSGMGLRIATDFAGRGARVIVACPFVEEGTLGRKIIIDKTGNEDVVFKLLDLASLESVRKFAADINQTEKRLDILINNAGIGTNSDFYTKDGMISTMQINYFGHFLLTILLVPLLKKTGTLSEPARVVNTSSILHRIGAVYIEKINSISHWSGVQLYGNSKLCLLLFAHELTKKLEGSNVVINSVDPGAVGTTIFNCFGKIVGTFITMTFNLLYKTPWQGAQTAIHVALDKEAGNVSGQFFKNCKLAKAKKDAYDDVLSKKLWDESMRLVELKNSNLSL